MNRRTRLHRALDRAFDARHADDEQTKTFTISAPAEVMDRFERFLAHCQWCGNAGHSTTIGMKLDGDGADRFNVKETLPKLDHGSIRDYECRTEIP